MPSETRDTKIRDTTNVVGLANDQLELEFATQYGPRVVGFARAGGVNSLAVLRDHAIGLPDGRAYLSYGGHRLWTAPEVPAITYEPDHKPVAVTKAHGQVTITQRPLGEHRIEKSLQVSLRDSSVSLVHTVTNRGASRIDVAPWAITQFPPGGSAILPLRREGDDADGLLPNTSIVLWPYTGVGDDPFYLDDRLLILDANRTTPTKVGTTLHRGWLAYARDGLVFVKRASHIDGGRYLDLNAAAQCYIGAHFAELETLGEQTVLEPGESATHAETWELYDVDPAASPSQIPELLGLDGGHL